MAYVLRRTQLTSPSAAIVVVAAGAARFGLHLLEMCAAMCLGVALLNLPALTLARAAGYPDPVTDLPEIAALIVAFNMAAPMALWMRVRRHHWRCIAEMSAAMFIEALVLIVAATVGVFPRESLVAWQHSLMLPAMVVVMVLRLDVYTRPLRHAAPA
jgi:hypothetical protein